MADWPALQRVVTRRRGQAHDWHTARMTAAFEADLRGDARIGRVVAELERELGRKARPFSQEFVLQPVRDEQVQPIGVGRYLVSERVYDGPRWPVLLRSLLISRA